MAQKKVDGNLNVILFLVVPAPILVSASDTVGLPGGQCKNDNILYEAGGKKFMKEEISQKIKQLIADRFDRSIDEVTEDASFVDDLGADSLDITELLMALEEEFNIEIDDDANNIVTVGQAIEYIAGRVE